MKPGQSVLRRCRPGANFQALFGAVGRGRPRLVASARRCGLTAVHGQLGEAQADHLVVGNQGDTVQLLCQSQSGPVLDLVSDGPVRTPGDGDPLVAGVVHQRLNGQAEYGFIGYASVVAAERVRGIELGSLGQ